MMSDCKKGLEHILKGKKHVIVCDLRWKRTSTALSTPPLTLSSILVLSDANCINQMSNSIENEISLLIPARSYPQES